LTVAVGAPLLRQFLDARRSLTACFANAQTASAVSKPQLMQPPPPRFQGIDLTHYLIGKNNVFAFLRREVCFRVITINQECIREGCSVAKCPRTRPSTSSV
jgi:hypothetical protein